MVAEAPPSSLDRYFYFPEVDSHDHLFRATADSILGADPDRTTKRQRLECLKVQGFFLIDLMTDPIRDPSSHRAHAPRLVARVKRLGPRRVILVKAPVFDAAFGPLRDAGLPVVNVRIPFPSTGHQLEFRDGFAKARRTAPVGVWRRVHDRIDVQD